MNSALPACDIIIPVWNQVPLVRRCLESIRHWTQPPFRVIAVDDASDEPARHYLERFEKTPPFPLLLIRNKTNLGFIRSTNRGLEASQGPYRLLLNSDTLVGKGWLREMIRTAERDPGIGLVNPASNSLGIRKPSLISTEVFAHWIHAARKGKSIGIGHAHGFCLLIRREVYQALGPLDESFGTGYYEDFDYCRRAHKAGFRCAMALGAYVYHEEHGSFRHKGPTSLEKEANKALYLQRHGPSLRILVVVTALGPPSIYERLSRTILPLLNAGHWVWFVTPWGVSTNELPRHAQARIYRLPAWSMKLWLRGKLAVKKKPFNVILSDDPTLLADLRRWLPAGSTHYGSLDADPSAYLPHLPSGVGHISS